MASLIVTRQYRESDEEELLRSFTHPGIRAGLEMELERIRLYSRELKTVEKYILSTVKNKPIFEHLQTIPGVGKILALTIYYEVGDIARFASAKQFCSYARVVPGLAQSGDVIRRGTGSKQGNPHLKWAFNQAAASFGSALWVCKELQAETSGQKTLEGQASDFPEHCGTQIGHCGLPCAQRRGAF